MSIKPRAWDAVTLPIPLEVSHLFKPSHFVDYPRIQIPQEFQDGRGSIRNIADGHLGDVAIIDSRPGAVRANHYHHEDWHFTYVVNGSITYEWTDGIESKNVYRAEFKPGELIFTPKGIPHRMKFSKDTTFVAVSKLSRMAELYEKDTVRLDPDFFGN